jgi:hypothetical protein
MINLKDILFAEERRKDIMHEAERRRLVKAILPAQPKPRRLYGHFLAGLGRSLTESGLRLQARYGGKVEIPAAYRRRRQLDPAAVSTRTWTVC